MIFKGLICFACMLFLFLLVISSQWTSQRNAFLKLLGQTEIMNVSMPHQFVYRIPQSAVSQDTILVFGWKSRKQQGTAPAGKDPWFHLGLAKTRSFQECYDRELLDVKYSCEYTEDRARFNESQAVLFRGRRLNVPFPKWRSQYQKWIFVEHEPPNKVWEMVNLTKYNSIFNLTATFAMDSDIPKVTYIRTCTRNYYKHKQLQDVDFAGKKRKQVPVAWFVSVCSTQSKREDYVKELSKYIPVDIYGKCGPKSCGSSLTWKTDNCVERLLNGENSYKFYLAFENSLCEDYVTEKLWKVIQLDIVPVVMGAVDYANMLPKDSYIDVTDFDSPKDLARFLKQLDEDDKLYNGYIRNKNSLVCNFLGGRYIPWECTLCKYLHENRNQKKVVHTLDHFWGSGRCLAPSYFRNRTKPGEFGYTIEEGRYGHKRKV